VSNVLLSGEKPGRIPDEVVQDLRALTDDSVDGYYHDPVHETPRFDANAPVLGLRGLFADKFGVYKGLAGNNAARCRVLFSFLGREAEFEVRAEDLAAA
jgi:transcription antitermination factor NusG